MRALKISGTKVYCFDPKYKTFMLMGNKVGDVFFKTVEEKHYMVVVGGYGFQYDAFVNFEQEGIKEIQILERHTGNTWVTKPKDWTEHGRIADYGRGKQIFLSLKYMHLLNKEKIQKEKEVKELERAKIIEQKSIF